MWMPGYRNSVLCLLLACALATPVRFIEFSHWIPSPLESQFITICIWTGNELQKLSSEHSKGTKWIRVWPANYFQETWDWEVTPRRNTRKLICLWGQKDNQHSPEEIRVLRSRLSLPQQHWGPEPHGTNREKWHGSQPLRMRGTAPSALGVTVGWRKSLKNSSC